MPAGELAGLKGDFDKINGVLANLVGDVQGELAEIWPVLKLLNNALGNVETAIINFNMEKARDDAWSFVEKLFPLSEEKRQQAIIDKDEMIALFSRVISRPWSSESFA